MDQQNQTVPRKERSPRAGEGVAGSFCLVFPLLLLYLLFRLRLDRFSFRVPVRITGAPEEQSDLWYISRIRLIHSLNFGYAIAARVPGLALTVSLALFGVSCLLF